jgi:hypothetical protein
MNIDKFKSQHVEILSRIASLRKLAHAGIEENAADIARELISMSTVIKGHLAIEDRILYPSLQKDEGTAVAAMSKTYQEEMKGIASAYIAFARHWSTAARLIADPQKFRDEANTVLKTVHTRMVRENTEFYPAIEAL